MGHPFFLLPMVLDPAENDRDAGTITSVQSCLILVLSLSIRGADDELPFESYVPSSSLDPQR